MIRRAGLRRRLQGRSREGGWNGLSADPDYGGQGLPKALEIAVFEMVQAANMAFGLCPMLTLARDRGAAPPTATARQKALYLPKLVSGEWTGTMNLTEPQAGSDLGAHHHARRAATARAAIALTGQKIFITWGDHDVADNIVHLVLARLPDAPPGSRGHVAVPGPQASGRRRRRARATPTTLRPASIEHKLGIHASPTCVMLYEGAKAELVGAPNAGLAAMFVMMNAARLQVGVQGVGHRRARLSAGAGLFAGAQAGPLGLDRRPARRASSTIRTCAAC